MKRTLLCLALLAFLFGALCLAFSLPQRGGADLAPDASAAPAPAGLAAQEILLWDAGRGQKLTLTARDYILGAAAAEMPAGWPDEAIKAQMVAAHCWALSQRGQGRDDWAGAWIAVNPALRQGYMDDAALQSFWGADYEQNKARFTALADEVQGTLLLWEGEPAQTCYHAISCGHTEASQNVWSTALPYLQGVDSRWDEQAADYETTVEYSAQQVYDALASALGLRPEGSPGGWLGRPALNANGYVESLSVGGQSVTGVQLREALRLRSACFAVDYDASRGVFSFTTRGYGHGVGLSQYGACAMAQDGQSCREILLHYFPGTTLAG